MKKRVLPLTTIFLLFLTYNAIVFATNSEETTIIVTTQISPIGPIFDSDLDWKVAVGDSMRYTFTKLFDLNDYDEDGSPYTQKISFVAENGSEIELSIREGSQLLCEIVTLDEYATIQLTLDGIKSEPSEGGGSFVTKTTDNRTYWEEFAKQANTEFQNVTVEGNLVVYRSVDNWDDRTYYSMSKINWRTGWFSYIYQKEMNGTHTLTEMEVSTEVPVLTPGFEISPLPVSLVLFSIYIWRKRRKE
ncbi:hypothetical protein CEE45_04600 [Candidatus Heimdallarchaeota archaeon B3_Heim]|nr:MAG: hypothetical protein CEE45_04600 [Candidatus Heimdallarchaeota archaeon B3_Heim]